MGAVVMDHVIIGEGAIIGAGAVITENTIVPAGTIWAGVPAKQVKELEVAKTKAMLGAHAERYNNYTKWWYKEKQTQNIEEMEEQVVLVNEKDEVQGTLGKLEAHEKGLLHQAISIVLFNEAGEILLQQRAANKYHWANIWSNTVCTHPRLNESHQTAAERRLYEELGFNTPLSNIFSFIYKATDEESGLIEHEFDHVFTGKYNGKIPFNPDEVQAVKWIKPNDLLVDIKQNPEKYSFWFKIILEEKQKRELLNH